MLILKQKLSKFVALCECTQCHCDYTCAFYDAKKSKVGDLCDKCKDVVTNMISLTQEGLNRVFHYNKETGDLTLRVRTRRNDKGTVITYKHSEGYLQVYVGNKEYLAHRLIWFMQTGIWPIQIDHENHDRSDNRWINLRALSSSRENQLNTKLSKNNSSGVNGVKLLPSGKFNAHIMVNRRQISLGNYETLEEAKSARLKADIVYGFHENHGS